MTDLFTFENYGELLSLLTNSIIAAALLGVVGGVVSVFVKMRDIALAVHGVAELSFAGAAFALFVGYDVVYGSLIGSLVVALIIGIGSIRSSETNSMIGVLMPFGIGLGILFLALFDGRAANKFGLLTGQIVAISPSQTKLLMVCAVIVLIVIFIIWRPLQFASVDPDIAKAKGVPTGTLTIVFMVTLGLAVALSVQVVGVLLVMSLLVTPAAAAMQLSSHPVVVPVLSVIFAVTSSVGGILIALGSPVVPISPFVTTISFLFYVIARIIGAYRMNHQLEARNRRLGDLDKHPHLQDGSGASARG